MSGFKRPIAVPLVLQAVANAPRRGVERPVFEEKIGENAAELGWLVAPAAAFHHPSSPSRSGMSPSA